MQYGEGAFVVFALLNTVDYPRGWIPGAIHLGKSATSPDDQASRERLYTGFNMLYLPTIANREPLEIALSLTRLREAMIGLKYEVECAKYYWRGDGENPYYEWKYEWKAVDRVFVAYELWSSKNGDSKCGLLERNDLQQRATFPWDIDQTLEDWNDLDILREELEQESGVRNHLNKLAERVCSDDARPKRVIISYLQRRACDIARYGQKLADKTFPQPTLKDTTPGEVADIVARMVTILNERTRRDEKKRDDDFLSKTKKEIQERFEIRFSKDQQLAKREFGARFHEPLATVPESLPARVLTGDDIQLITEACRKEIVGGDEKGSNMNGMLTVIGHFVRFCELINIPVNHIKTPSGQYVEKAVSSRQVADMTNEMAQELMKLPRFTAYAKVINEQDGVQRIITQKITTVPLPSLLADVALGERDTVIEENSLAYYRHRKQIEEEICQRQERWRGAGLDKPPPSVTSKVDKGRAKKPPPSRC